MKCEICNRKLPLVCFACKCKLKFCKKHQNDHNCTFDYKEYNKDILSQQNPKIEVQKLIRL